MDEKVSVALRRALLGWCTQPGAFTAARNGGAESVLRNVVLGEFEVELACLGFAEANGEHVDAALVCTGSLPLCFEFKHGMLHQRQLSSIKKDSENAVGQLLEVRASARYYIHFIHALECDDPADGFALMHNSRVFTSYKKFQKKSCLQELLQRVGAILGPVWFEVSICQERFPDVRATIYCWAFSVESTGRVALGRD